MGLPIEQVKEIMATKEPRDMQRYEAIAVAEYLLEQRDELFELYHAGKQALENAPAL